MIRNMAFMAALWLAATASPGAEADPLRTAVFDIELIDTSLEGEMLGKSDAEALRTEMLTRRLREALGGSGRYELVDIAPVREEARNSNLQSCGGCERRFAGRIGAEASVTGVVHKVSNLILNINIYIRDVGSGELIGGGSADIRSNTDESWTRGLDWLLEHRILPQEAAQ